MLLLNLPLDKRGFIHDNDIHSLKEMKRILHETFQRNLFLEADCKSVKKDLLTDSELSTFWKGEKDPCSFEFTFDQETEFDRLLLQENITSGQRVESFQLEYKHKGEWKKAVEGTTIGYKRILRFSKVQAKEFRIVINQSRNVPQISEVGLYLASSEE